jgi:hypothetical protein
MLKPQANFDLSWLLCGMITNKQKLTLMDWKERKKRIAGRKKTNWKETD